MLAVYRYIELNPVRAEMVKTPQEYSWSSYNYNALGIKTDMITPHDEYLSLGNTDKSRQESYIELFASEIDEKLLLGIRTSANKGLAL